MTASASSQQQMELSPPSVPPSCIHSRIFFGLDRAYCPDCKRGFKPSTPEYQAVLHQPAPEQSALKQTEQLSKVAPEQLPSKVSEVCSGADPLGSTPTPHWIEIYSPSRRPNCKYYRYMWMEGRKLKHKHIGGNIKAPRAIALKEQVELAIKEKRSPAEIVQIMKSWKVANG